MKQTQAQPQSLTFMKHPPKNQRSGVIRQAELSTVSRNTSIPMASASASASASAASAAFVSEVKNAAKQDAKQASKKKRKVEGEVERRDAIDAGVTLDEEPCENTPTGADINTLIGPTKMLISNMNETLLNTLHLNTEEADAVIELLKKLRANREDTRWSTYQKACDLVNGFHRSIFCWNRQRQRLLVFIFQCICLVFALRMASRGLTEIALPFVESSIRDFSKVISKMHETMSTLTTLLPDFDRSARELQARVQAERTEDFRSFPSATDHVAATGCPTCPCENLTKTKTQTSNMNRVKKVFASKQ
jgi:hypothetical protein